MRLPFAAKVKGVHLPPFIIHKKLRARLQVRPNYRWVWWTILCLLLVWNAWVFYPRGEKTPEISYTSFLKQVRAANVSQIVIQDNQIRGTFKNPVTWPEQLPAVTTEAEALKSRGPDAASQVIYAGQTKQPVYSEFTTTLPRAIYDPNLWPLLEQQGIIVMAARSDSYPLLTRLFSLLPALFLVGFVVLTKYGVSSMRLTGEDLPARQTQRYTTIRPRATLAEVVGQDEAKTDLTDIVDFLRKPEKFHQFKTSHPWMVLIIGPAGTGKKLLAEAVAGEARVPLLSINLSELIGVPVNNCTAPLRSLFADAKRKAPIIVFLDELDALTSRWGTASTYGNEQRSLILNHLLQELDSLEPHRRVVVLASATRPEELSPALLRPGRFTRQLLTELPGQRERMEILRRQTRELPLNSETNLEDIARRTTGLSGSDLVLLCRQASLLAARHHRKAISEADFTEALTQLLSSGEIQNPPLGEDERRRAAYHEAGHATIALLLPSAEPLRSLCILPRIQAASLTQRKGLVVRQSHTRMQLLASLTVLLGGRTAEELTFGDVTTKAEDDLDQATQLARRMVARWGMGDLGPISLPLPEDQALLEGEITLLRLYSEASAAQIDRSVRVLLEDRHAVARHLLKNNRAVLDRLARLLLREEKVTAEQAISEAGPLSPIALPEKVVNDK